MRRRLGCRSKFIFLMQRKESKHLLNFGAKDEIPNATLSIAKKWKENNEDVKMYFSSIAKELSNEYYNKVSLLKAENDIKHVQELKMLMSSYKLRLCFLKTYRPVYPCTPNCTRRRRVNG